MLLGEILTEKRGRAHWGSLGSGWVRDERAGHQSKSKGGGIRPSYRAGGGEVYQSVQDRCMLLGKDDLMTTETLHSHTDKCSTPCYSTGLTLEVVYRLKR